MGISTTSAEDEYKVYLQQAESLPREMIRRGIQFVSPRFVETDFRVYADGTAEVQTRVQPLLAKFGLKQKTKKRVGLESVGELLYHLTPNRWRYQEGVPNNLDYIPPADLKGLASALSVEEDVIKGRRAPVKGL